MTNLPLSPAAACLMRALRARAGTGRDEILLTRYRSTDWNSLTFLGERHEMVLQAVGPDAGLLADRIVDKLAEADFSIAGQIVADIGLAAPLEYGQDGSVGIRIEALTVAE